VNQKPKRRKFVGALFPNEASLLRLVSTLLCVQSDEWCTSKVYLTIDSTGLPTLIAAFTEKNQPASEMVVSLAMEVIAPHGVSAQQRHSTQITIV
jgi:hypothetical protein